MLLPSLEALGDFPPEGVALPVLSEETASEPPASGEAVPLSPAEVPLMLLFRQNLLRRVSRLLRTRWGDRTQKVWARLRSLLFLVPVRESFMCAPLLFALLVAFGQTNFASCTSYLRVLACASIGPVTWPCFLRSVSCRLLLPVTKALHALERGSGRMQSHFSCELYLSQPFAFACFQLVR